MRLFLGVDGGQTGTIAMIGDETGRVAGVGRGPACRHEGAIETAVSGAGGVGVAFQAACFGLSGGVAGKEAWLRGLVQADRYVITHDAAIALTGALAGEPGIIAIAGTGSMAWGLNRAGRTARAGGWGYVFGDEGGAFDLVRQALRAALRREEGWGPPTALLELLLAASGAPNANELMHLFYTGAWPRERVAGLAPLLDQAAAAGDVVAQEILKGAGQSLAALAGIVRGRLYEQREAAVVSYTGGVFRSPVVLERFRMLVELEDGIRVEAPRFPPAAGALIEAYRAAGLEALPTEATLPAEVPLEKP
jgi:N-acetylglucosamine kinase-like BadF-type ATPase